MPGFAMLQGVGAGIAAFVLFFSLLSARQAAKTQQLVARVAAHGGQLSAIKAVPRFSFNSKQIRLFGACVVVVLWFNVGVVPALLVLAAGLSVQKFAKTVADRRRAAAYQRSLPEALDSVVRSLRSGAGMFISFSEVPLSGQLEDHAALDFRRVARDAEAGLGMVGALEVWAQRKPLKSVGLCVSALSLAIECGSSNALAVEQVAATLRHHLDAVDSAKTAATEARASAWLLVALPFVIAIPLLIVNQGARSFMFHHPAGVAALLVGFSLEVLGAWWMHRLINGTTL